MDSGTDRADTNMPEQQAVVRYYDTGAADYASRLWHELDGKPFDRFFLDRLAIRLQGTGLACELGCGPGQVARYLHDRGVDIFGTDLSSGMIAEAKRCSPHMIFTECDMLHMPYANSSFAATVLFYAIVHLPTTRLAELFQEMRRLLQPDGLLVLAFHTTEMDIETIVDEASDEKMIFVFHSAKKVEILLIETGFDIEELVIRTPYKNMEYPSRRCYIVARKDGE